MICTLTGLRIVVSGVDFGFGVKPQPFNFVFKQFNQSEFIASHIFTPPEYHGMSGVRPLKNLLCGGTFMCNNGCFGGNWCWIIILLILFCGCGNSGTFSNNGCGNHCGCDNNCGCC